MILYVLKVSWIMMNMPNEETTMVMNLLIVRVNFIKRIMQICSRNKITVMTPFVRNVSFLMMKKMSGKTEMITNRSKVIVCHI